MDTVLVQTVHPTAVRGLSAPASPHDRAVPKDLLFLALLHVHCCAILQWCQRDRVARVIIVNALAGHLRVVKEKTELLAAGSASGSRA